MTSSAKVVKLSKIQKMPKAPKFLVGIGREEWDRVAPQLFSLGRLDLLSAHLLEMYCSCHGDFVYFSGELSHCDPTEKAKIRFFQSEQKSSRRRCGGLALGFGFRLDAAARINIEKPLSLTAAAKILHL
jgi:phage terminase small subunit